MITFQELKSLSIEELYGRRANLYRIRVNRSIPKEVRDAADVLLNFYGAEIDARMSEARS